MYLTRILAKRVFPDFESRLRLRRIINSPRDAFESLTGRRDPLIPPHGLWFVGGENQYRAINQEFLGYFLSAGLTPDSVVLDVGCGIGVMAARLAHFLSPEGIYHGFDIVRTGIEWAEKNISSRYPNFIFSHVDIYNQHYNPHGVLRPENFTFPYPDSYFSFVFAKSLFTHMTTSGASHYLAEIRRVLKPHGAALVTAFLHNEESDRLIDWGKSSIPLKLSGGGYYVVDPKVPETAVALRESDFVRWCTEAGLRICEVRYGSWCGRDRYVSYQDLVFLE